MVAKPGAKKEQRQRRLALLAIGILLLGGLGAVTALLPGARAQATTVVTVSPDHGAACGGTAVTITGSGFAAGATVKFDGVAATGVTVVSATSITATTPAHVPATVDVTVTSGSTTGTDTNGYTYQTSPNPTFTSVAPVGGPPGGGTSVTIAGTHFCPGATVKFGDPDLGLAVTSLAASQQPFVCQVAAGAAGAQDDDFYLAFRASAPTTSGSVAAGDVRLTPVGSKAAGTMVAASDTTELAPTFAATCIAPVFKTVDTNGNGAIDAGDWLILDTGAAANLAGAPTGAAAGFTPGDLRLTQTDTTAHAAGTFVGAGDSDLTGHAFASAGFPAVALKFADGNADAAFDAQDHLFVGPAGSAGLNDVKVFGSPFGTRVRAGQDAATNVVVAADGNSLTATTPAHVAGAADLAVDNPDGASPVALSRGAFLYAPPPTVTAVAPIGGPPAGGNTVHLTGTGFQTGATVKFGTTAGTGVTVVSATQITVLAPAGTSGATVGVAVTNPDTQSATLASAYTYRPAPTVTAITPSTGSLLGSTQVKITGTGFLTAASVKIGGVTAVVTSLNATTIHAVTGAHAAGAVTVNVTNTDSQMAIASGLYTYAQLSPTIGSVHPDSGSTVGGTTVLVNGTGFATGVTVKLGGAAVTGVVFLNDTHLLFVTAAHAAGAADLRIANTDGANVTKTAAFTFIPPPPPVITAITPATGQVEGGAAIRITGTAFVVGASVHFGDLPCTGLVVLNATTIVCNSPPHVAGAVSVVVTNPDNQASGGSPFTYAGSAIPDSAIEAANLQVVVTVQRDGGDNVVNFTLPSSPPAAVAGVQVFRSNSPYVLVTTLAAGSSGFVAHGYRDAGAPLASTYAVTVYYANGVGKANSAPSEIPGFASVKGVQSPAVEQQFYTMLALWIGGGLVLLVLIVLLILLLRRRGKAARRTGDVGYVAPRAGAGWDEPQPEPEPEPAPVPVAPRHSVNCPVCKSTFEAIGEKPLRMKCPNCGREGILR